MHVGCGTRQRSRGQHAVTPGADQPAMILGRQLVAVEMVELCVEHFAVGTHDRDLGTARAAATQRQGRIGQANAGGRRDFPALLRQTLFQAVDTLADRFHPMFEAVQPLENLSLEPALGAGFHVGANDAVAPCMEGRRQVLGVGEADLPMAEGSAAPSDLGEDQLIAVLAGNKGNMLNKISALFGRLSIIGRPASGRLSRLPHVRQAEQVATEPNAGSLIIQFQHLTHRRHPLEPSDRDE